MNDQKNKYKLQEEQIEKKLMDHFKQLDLSGKKVIVIIPDDTRSGPTGLFFKKIHKLLGNRVKALDFLIALGTHQPLSNQRILKMLDLSEDELYPKYSDVNIINHNWKNPDTLTDIGTIEAGTVEDLSQGLLSRGFSIRINKKIFEYDHVLVCGPVFPHEVVGFSGGNKYFFPGISGQEVIDVMHWLGALITSYKIIGKQDTPVRDLINLTASRIEMSKSFICYVVEEEQVAGVFCGDHETAWNQAVELSSELNIKYVDKPFKSVLSVMPAMYDDLWTGAKGMYKLEPVVTDGGEVIIYAPHINEISYTHGEIIEEIGYHVRDYFVKQWDQFKKYPWGVLAHSTHLRGMGRYDPVKDEEQPRIKMTLATGISSETCRKINLGYRDPDSIEIEDWRDRKDEGRLLVPHAGEQLYRLKNK